MTERIRTLKVFNPVIALTVLLMFGNVAFAYIDDDSDGMSDVWEDYFDLPSLAPDDGADDDPDSDLFDNVDEWGGGTDPGINSDAEKPDFRSVYDPYLNEDDEFEFKWYDKLYKVYYVQGHNGSTWVNLSGAITGNGGTYHTFTMDEDDGYGSSSANYRLVINNATDSDSDGLDDYEEYLFGSNRTNADGDNDDLDDPDEFRNGTDPDDSDSDDDGKNDGWEVTNSYNPLSKDNPDVGLEIFAPQKY